MRLSAEQADVIRQTVEAYFAAPVTVRLFGSRLDDEARGGDIDLLVETSSVVDRPAFSAADLAARLERRLDGRRVDVVLVTPSTPEQPIHRLAHEKGVVL